jgi:ADP-heptose:LPS heptosyltransferase
MVGTALVSVLALPETVAIAREPRSFLLIRPGGIGDAVLLIPAIQAIRAQYPSAKITVLAERRNASAFLLCPEVNAVLFYDRPSELFSALRGDYDVVIDTEQWYRLSAVVARMTRAPVLIGYATNERSRLFTHPIAYSHDEYEAEMFFRLLDPLGIQPYRLPVRFLTVPSDAAGTASDLLVSLENKRFVTIFPGASIPERRWGADRFRLVAEMLSAFGIPVVVVGGRDDKGQGETIVSGGVGLNLAGRTSLTETAGVIDKSSLLLSGDSGVLHMAVGLGRPSVSLFGPGRAKKWAPRGERNCVINKGLPCSPCTTFGTTPPCHDSSRCMKEITVDEVFNAVMILLTAEGVLPSTCCKRDWVETAGRP